MKEFLYSFFAEYKTQIVFLHVISAVVWVGGMIAMRFAAHHSIQMLETPALKLQRTAHALKRLFTIVSPFVIILLVSAIIMSVGYGFRAGAVDVNGDIIDEYAMYLYNLVHVKEVIWMIMSLNLGFMIFKRNKAQKFLNQNDFAHAKNQLEPIGKYMVPLNIILGIIAIYLGVTLRNGY
jgi:uncharacterized membrane protein